MRHFWINLTFRVFCCNASFLDKFSHCVKSDFGPFSIYSRIFWPRVDAFFLTVVLIESGYRTNKKRRALSLFFHLLTLKHMLPVVMGFWSQFSVSDSTWRLLHHQWHIVKQAGKKLLLLHEILVFFQASLTLFWKHKTDRIEMFIN